MLSSVAFDRKTSNYRREIRELRAQGTVYRFLVWTADGRPHPAVTRTLQHAADIASCRNGQRTDGNLRHVVHEQRALVEPPPTALQLTNRQRGVQMQLDLTIAYALPAQPSEFALQVIDLTQILFNGMTGIIE